MIHNVRLPPPVEPGNRVGIAALSGPVEPEALEKGLDGLRRLGFEPVPASNVGQRSGLFAGSDAERLSGFHELAADPSIAAIFFARGGHGILRLLPSLDWKLLRARPRAYVGYSDATPLLNQIVQQLGLVAFHGPMVASDLARGLEADEESSLLASLGGALPLSHPVTGFGETVEGPLIGGCLSLLTATLETSYAPDLDGSVLFWEDIHEPLYRIDRMLTHLNLSGRLNRIKAMVVGCVEPVDQGQAGSNLIELLDSLAEKDRFPRVFGLSSGHCRPNLTLPLGLIARVDPSHGELTIGLPTRGEA